MMKLIDEAPIGVSGFRRSLRALEREIAYALQSQTDCCGVTTAQCHALLEISDRGTVTAGELAESLILDKSTLSRTVSGLEASGWIERAEDPDNRRRALLTLTPDGRKRVVKVDRLCDRLYGKLLASLKESERATMVEGTSILARELSGLRTGGGTCCGLERKVRDV